MLCLVNSVVEGRRVYILTCTFNLAEYGLKRKKTTLTSWVISAEMAKLAKSLRELSCVT